MKKTTIIRFAQSLVFLPMMTIMTPAGNISVTSNLSSQIPQVVFMSQNQAPVVVDPVIQAEADAIDAYFKDRGMPLYGTGMKMVEAANDNDLDWRLLPAIAVRESTGGKFDCKKVENNPFGWGSCKIGFNTIDDAINTVAKNLGGNNPNTAKHYDNKTIKQILRSYNPPSVVPRYAEQVMSIMNAIGPAEMTVVTPSAT